MEDPRVFFAAERTLLAWQRTGMVLIAFGFVVERAGLLLKALGQLSPVHDLTLFWLGVIFMLLGVLTIVIAVFQFSRLLPSFSELERPAGYRVGISLGLNLLVATAGMVMVVLRLFLRF
ncbi:MAG: DUF202 domain-containing protein [Methylophaga sp.]|nr:DUF202 domain-containing protein [Methylophaga sp.]